MTLVGLTALSVEIITNFLVSYFTAKSATTRVPSTLFQNTSSGVVFHHRYMFICGSVEYIIRVMFLEDLFHTLLTADVAYYRVGFYCRRLFSIIRRMSCNGVSAWSTNINFTGSNVETCRTISLPMLPAAPVISIFCPFNSLPTASISICISSRGSKSSSSTSF